MRQRRIIALLLLAALGASAPEALAGKKKAKRRDAPQLKTWADGPIRYIARKEEMQAFRALDSEGDRALFIEKFWARRDPTPATLSNEYRQLFWERVKQANDNFIDSTKPGSMTDRGKVHILYGPPTEVEDHVHLETQGLPTGGRGVIRWIYEGRPGQRMDLNPIVVVPFVRDASGEYRISHDPQLASVFFDANAIREQNSRNTGGIYFGNTASPRASELSVMLDLGKMQEVPPQEVVLLERVETMEAYQTHPIDVRTQVYHDADEQGAIVALTVDLGESVEKPAIIAKFAPFDATQEPRVLGEDSFRMEASANVRIAQGRIRLAPGRYTVTVMTADPSRAATGLDRGTLNVPAAGARMRFSDIVWAHELESLEYASLASYTEPFIVGPFRVVPRIHARFRPGDRLLLFYEVYGATFPVRVSYQLEGRETDGAWSRLGQPQIGQQSASGQGWELVTGERWPEGEYRVQIEVVDADGRLVTSEVPFTLEGPASP